MLNAVALQKISKSLIPLKLPLRKRKPPGSAEKPLVLVPGLAGGTTFHRAEADFIKVPAEWL